MWKARKLWLHKYKGDTHRQGNCLRLRIYILYSNELFVQAYTRKPCVDTEKPMGTQDNFSQSKEGHCKRQTLCGHRKAFVYSKKLVCRRNIV